MKYNGTGKKCLNFFSDYILRSIIELKKKYIDFGLFLCTDSLLYLTYYMYIFS